MPTKKKINYYYLTLEGEESTVLDTLEILHNEFQSQIADGNPFQVSLPGGKAMSLSTFSRYLDYAYHCCMFLKHNEFPEIIDNTDSSRTEIPEEFDDDKML